MKKTILLTLFAFIILKSQAQLRNETAKYFFKSSQKRFIETLSQSELKLNKQAEIILNLVKLNNELKASGDMASERFHIFDSLLIGEKFKNDSFLNKASDLKNSFSTISKTKRRFTKFIKEVPVFTAQIAREDYGKQMELEKIEKNLKGSSLVIEKKIMKVILADAGKNQEIDLKKIDEIKEVKEYASKEGTQDKAILETVDLRLQTYIKSIEENAKEIKDLEATISNPEEFSKNSASIKVRVFIIDSLVNKTAESKAYTFKMLEESMKKSTKTLFNLAAFFGPGGYSIPEDKKDKAKAYFSPLVDSLIKFSNAYAQLPRTATVVVNGYADATQITKGSPLYKEITKQLKISEPTKQQLNIALSTLRAEKLSELFSKIIKEKSNSFIALPKILFENIEVGRGEELPDPTIKYKDNDERRRIVAVFWSVLPR